MGEPFPGIEYNYVTPAFSHQLGDVVLKVAPPWQPVEIFGEAAYLAARNGNGCVRLLAEAHDRRAILLERIDPGQNMTEFFAGRESEAVTPAIEALKKVLLPVPVSFDHIAPVNGWFDALRKVDETAFPAEYAFKAFDIYDRLSLQPGRTFYLHGDFHPGNIVTQRESSFCVIDPKGWSGHIGYEISVFLNNYRNWLGSRNDINTALDVAVDQFSATFDISPDELRQWAFAEMVIGAWWNFVDMPDLYNGEVANADIWDV